MLIHLDDNDGDMIRRRMTATMITKLVRIILKGSVMIRIVEMTRSRSLRRTFSSVVNDTTLHLKMRASPTIHIAKEALMRFEIIDESGMTLPIAATTTMPEIIDRKIRNECHRVIKLAYRLALTLHVER